jgi:integrase
MNMNTIAKQVGELVEKYLESKELAWSPATLKGEGYRLRSLAPSLNGDAMTLWKAVEHLKPYSKVTAWTRATHFWQWACDRGHFSSNPYRVFREDNARLFKNVYETKTPKISYAEAKRLIERQLTDKAMRNKALQLLSGGLRWSESRTLEDAHVIGKGGKRRKVFVASCKGPIYQGPYHNFYRALKRIGLTPHMLRKLAASALARNGLAEQDLMKAMGWSSIVTAKAYLAPLRDEEMAKVFKRMQAG